MSDQFLTIPIRSDKLTMTAKVTQSVYSQKTEFQQIDIVDTEVFGRALLLDGHIQLTTMDEHAYHEALVQIPLLNLNNPRSALVIGGGDGGVLRELCKNKTIEHIDMVEIDQGVVDASRLHLPDVSARAFEDERVHLHIADAFHFVKNAPRQYDLIVADSTDTYEDEDGALSEMLFTDQFYRDCLDVLKHQGVLVTQADNLVFCPYSMEAILKLFRKVFPKTGSYQAIVPSFGGFSGFVWASKGTEISATLPEGKLKEVPLQYLNEVTYAFAFKPLRF